MYYQEIETIYRENLEQRYMAGIHLPEMLKSVTRSLVKGQHIVIVTGFVVKDAMAGETDGPPGALALARTLQMMGKKVTIVTDGINEILLEQGIKLLGLSAELVTVTNETIEVVCEELIAQQPSHVIAIERPSRAKDGQCYSMRGEAITDFVPNTDIIFEHARKRNIVTIGIGDGGNEVGMGTIKNYVHSNVPKGALICATSEVDYLLIGGVSNWVAYGVCAALSIEQKQLLLHTNRMEELMIERLVTVGAVDGIDKVPVMKVDGLEMEVNLRVLSAIRLVVTKHINQ